MVKKVVKVAEGVEIMKQTTKQVQTSEIKPSKYQRLFDRSKELAHLYKQNQNDEILMEDDSLEHVVECEGLRTYEFIAEQVKNIGATRVIDIGCAYGHQSEVFLNEGLEYVGVNHDNLHFWNRDTFDYVVDTYPCALPIQPGDIGVSVLGLTWTCYLTEGDKTLHEQCEALQRDFKQCLVYTQPSHVGVLSSYFKEATQIDRNLFYYSNK